MQEQMLGKADGQLDNLERLVHDLEFSQVEMQVLDGLKTGNEALNKIHQVLNIEEVERIMDDTREAVEKQKVFFLIGFLGNILFYCFQKELDELLSGALTAEDELEVEAELEALVAASEPASTLPEVPVEEPEELLPSVPTHEPKGEISLNLMPNFGTNYFVLLQPRKPKRRRKGWLWRRHESHPPLSQSIM